MPKIHLVIPARYKSTRLPAKPLLPIHGKPMILWTAAKAMQASFADTVCVATDDERIYATCQDAGVNVVMTDGAHPSGTDRLAQVATDLSFGDDDIVINMQGDEPLVPPVLLEQVMQLLIDNPDCAMATLCEPITDSDEFARPSVVKVVMDNAHRALYFSRAPIPHDRDGVMTGSTKPVNAYRHLGLYAYRVRVLKAFTGWEQGVLEKLESLEQLRVLENGERIAIDVAKVALPAGVDTPEDLERLNAMPIEALMAFD
ncbi:3-deoxy-manno-octulosonate cytidylyltransferase [Moraxella sp. FZLJ2107]|uniref:3-deoxy-manno-octulosonate cytidylyltransferase n=1 Tax=unclassified Moraxella TaxID=2685852 RepID=UPI0020C8B1B5|nr:MULTISPECIES: 3-deoxy-manno-octulosonate cytidylyltransferase [unclassified Moraxella]UTO05882.1 3-deoxy-manno-octulosonate cytidylyltransferase [Moraxella sp. FZLJ2107]UTO22618.1 3-deoxy-manno-octulosonate cytidylyltransferase [Moraxella sp. FZLJ2109]